VTDYSCRGFALLAARRGSLFSQVRFALGANGGVRIEDAKQLCCMHPAMDAFADDQPSLALLARSGRVGLGC
jgi:hypothetical protein